MELPPVCRVFYAIALPEAVTEDVKQYISRLKKAATKQSIKWTRPENLHITLQFLAEIKSSDIEPMLHSIREALPSKVQEINIRTKDVLLFPNSYRPRVIALSVTPKEPLTLLSDLIGVKLLSHGYSLDERPYQPHITIGRVAQIRNIDLSFLQREPPLMIEPFRVTEMTLFRSEPEQHGSLYTAIGEIKI